MRKNERYTHGHHESVLRSHRWRTAENSAGFLLPHIHPDQRILDVGCGPGNLTIDLARRVPRGSVMGIDVAPEAIEHARSALNDEVANVTFSLGDVYHLDFDDASFDVVFAHQVLQHLGEPVSALEEMRRVLADGGLLAVRDADYGSFTWAPDDERLEEWMDLYQRLARANGTEPDTGRYLSTWARDAGFELEAVTATSWVYWRPDERQWWAQLWADRVRFSAFAAQCLEYGLARESDLERLATGFLEWADTEDGVFIVPSTEVLARA